MRKEFEIDDILNAVNSISEIKKENIKAKKEKNFTKKNDILRHNNQVKSDKSEILVLDQMIE